ncbi:MAG: GNAT family N-acetyltransferase [Lachnospiraceae bacterium]|nr:GNAT family N-acetyltransferase [Lachnospiraceae bacterium]
MNFVYEKTLTPRYEEDVRQLLYGADHEFVPPLSSRNDTTQASLLPGKASGQPPVSYFETMRHQSFLLAIDNDRVVGFLSFIPAHTVQLQETACLCSYVSTIIVDPAYRGRALTILLYQKLFEITQDPSVVTRTWSQNIAHLTILHRLGFALVMTLPNDRGEGIDTVYYQKEITHA